ncbi:GGDEF domain-containing protein [Sulfidibacter corallicola]|uniref:diguanylate cyclase n=1 Tax=Sulfidibacter corallicola TaxID=2818388 RepID=A0A8A4TXP6_SULCO|nr:GGDEF domain-containing protein [Sulfidibacter corallicola]QTD54107.1 GGDEF domain-containing protein [Sulfidibacter corallicola]
MTSSVEKRYIEIIEIMLEALTLDQLKEIESLLQPLRIFIHDVGRFSSNKIFESKFNAFIKTRDEHLTPTAQEETTNDTDKKTKEQINAILDQALDLLESGVKSSQNLDGDMKDAIAKIRQAKTINNLRALSQVFLDAGNQIVSSNQDFHDGLSRLAVELSFCQKHIEQLENQLEHTKREADKDPLTGLFNRRVFDRHLKEAVERSARFQAPLCLLLLDIDHFKEINDEWGHQIGDDVLINFANLLSKSLRGIDLTYRLGGDEFAIIFSGCTKQQALVVAQRVHDFVGKNPYHIKDVRFFTTLSAGLAQHDPTENANDLFRRADEFLYRAKKQGRNQVVAQP